MAQKTKSTSSSLMRSDRLLSARMIQNFHLVWLDGSNNGANNDHHRNSIADFQQIINNVNVFIDVDECVDFITDCKEEKAMMIISGEFNQMILPVVQEIDQVNSIFIFSENKVLNETWTKKWSKVKGVYADTTTICAVLKQSVQDCDQNSISISFVKKIDGISKPNLDQLNQSFMYTQILKEILLTIDFQQEHFDAFFTYCREQFIDSTSELRNIEKLAKEYHDRKPIWWYTYQCFLYSMLNRALRTMEIVLIIQMGFFVRDLHNHIAILHAEQYGGETHSSSFTVYRGQGLSQTDFEQLKSTQGGLLVFNNFLSASHHRDVSLKFVQRTITSSSLVGVLFVMQIDPSISAIPFANVKDVSCYQKEDEILFSMHSVFRVGEMKQIEKDNRLWQVELTLTSDSDPQLHRLTESIREETFSSSRGWFRLGQLLTKLAQFDKAEELYEILLRQSTDEGEKGHLYHIFGTIKSEQGKNKEAVGYYEKSIAIKQKMLPPTHVNLIASYSDIGLVYDKLGEYSKALSYYEQALEIKQKDLPPNHPSLATSYNNIGVLYYNLSEYSKALSSYEKALQIRQKTLPANHSDFATSYNNIGFVYQKIDEYAKALSYLERTLDIFQRSLPPNHPNIKTVKESIEIIKRKL